ncbi:hypothetical protein [Ornithinimicrobium faecis]|uniref:hypothetical protein n=1 Tax=Ornithinimicrobium faecis TaxID=2934158 RepID=UPI002119B032|nr:hypothetical protein [Ornithinimicrobium sp. HY1745]
MEPMVELSRWPGSRDEAFPERQVLVLPGRGYTVQLPGLHLPVRTLALHGWKAWIANWVGVDNLSDIEEVRALVVRACEDFVHQTGKVPDLVLAKSMGTLAAGWVADHAVPAIWTTPLLNDEVCVRDLGRSMAPAMLVGGSEDSMWDDAAAAKTGLSSVVVAGADHSWQIGDWRAELAGFEHICGAIEEFAARVAAPTR